MIGQNKINVIACGGAGISLADNVVSNIAELGSGFAEISIKYIDTSRNNIDKIDHEPKDFWMVQSKSFGDAVISGSGSMRTKNVADIAENVKEFLDSNKMKEVTGEYTVVISSASGGSGSVLSPVITRQLLDRNIPTGVFLVGDSSNGLSAKNTLNTLASFNQIATKVCKKSLSMVYVNNEEFSNLSKLSAMNEANKRISNTLAVMSLFLSGCNGGIDAQDMNGLIDQGHYKGSLDIKPGLYGLATFSGEITLPTTAIPTSGRTLVPEGMSPDINITLLHHKSGTVTDENALAIYDGQFPIHMVSYSGFFVVEREMLSKVVSDYDNVMNSIEMQDIDGTDDSVIDENGLVL